MANRERPRDNETGEPLKWFLVTGEIAYRFHGHVWARDENHAEAVAKEEAADGMFLDNYQPPNNHDIDIYDVTDETSER